MKNKIITGIVGILLSVAAFLLGGSNPLGSTISGQGYRATTTSSLGASATYSPLVCSGNSIFGSVIVSQLATAGFVRVWNATSTATSTYQTDNINTAGVTFGKELVKVDSASDVAGTYTFDVGVEKGVVVETASDFNGQYVLTCKY
jgi:hypothetical protein